MSQPVFQGHYFSIEVDATGTEYVSTGDEVLVVALTEDREVLFTVEPSAAFDAPTWILPGGETAPGRTLAETANLELQEEVGYKAGRLDYLGELHPYSKYLAVRSYVYLARQLSASSLVGDESYPIGVERVPLAATDNLIASGRLHDARVIAALYLARTFLEREDP
jgi:ADP-ribose diphosphatase